MSPKAVVRQDSAQQDITVQVSGVGLASTDKFLARCNGRYLNVQARIDP